MCWSYEVSITSFFIGLLVSLILINRNKNYDKVLGYLILFYSFIQLWEAQLWIAVKNNNIQQNLQYTKFIYLTLWIQAFAIGVGIYQVTNDWLIMAIGASLFIYGYYNMPFFNISKPNKESHLKWGFDDTFYEIVTIVILFGIIRYTNLNYTWLSFLFLMTPYIYLKINKNASLSSLWCWFAAMFSFIALSF